MAKLAARSSMEVIWAVATRTEPTAMAETVAAAREIGDQERGWREEMARWVNDGIGRRRRMVSGLKQRASGIVCFRAAAQAAAGNFLSLSVLILVFWLEVVAF